jgi:DNA-binding FrmR family transcriptional regulator
MNDTEQEQERLRTNVLSRMKRIEGQVRGIQRMIHNGKECEDILVQVKAVRSALQAVNQLVLRRYLLRCYGDAAKDAEEGNGQPEALERVIKVLTNFMD